MNSADSALEAALITTLRASGIASSAQLQRATAKSQPTVSRALGALGGRVVALGQGKATRYGLLESIRGLAGQQPLWCHRPESSAAPSVQ